MSIPMMNRQIADYFRTQPVSKAWLFGAFARGEEKPWSDVDILVEFDKDCQMGLFGFLRIKNDLEDLVGRDVDLVEDGTLRPYALENVNRDKKLIYEKGYG